MEAILNKPLVGEQPRAWLDPARIGLGLGQRGRSLERQVLALENRAPGTYGHAHRVGVYGAELARTAGLSRTEARRIKRAGALHDIGKTKVPGEILNKRGPLTVQEFVIVSRHAQLGATMVSVLGDPDLTATVRHHHEAFDGTGYPDGLVGEEIPLGARIIAVCDTFDSLTTNRPYRQAIGYPDALALLEEEAGTQLDPGLVTLFQERFARAWATA